MKLLATASPFEALSPAAWTAFRKMVLHAGNTWGIAVAFEENPTVTEAIANYWAAQRIHENARLAKPEDA